jgi:hypothetical protein
LTKPSQSVYIILQYIFSCHFCTFYAFHYIYTGNLFQFKFPRGIQKSTTLIKDQNNESHGGKINGEDLTVNNELVNDNSPGMMQYYSTLVSV